MEDSQLAKGERDSTATPDHQWQQPHSPSRVSVTLGHAEQQHHQQHHQQQFGGSTWRQGWQPWEGYLGRLPAQHLEWWRRRGGSIAAGSWQSWCCPMMPAVPLGCNPLEMVSTLDLTKQNIKCVLVPWFSIYFSIQHEENVLTVGVYSNKYKCYTLCI